MYGKMKNLELKNIHKNETCLIFGNGSSLKYYDRALNILDITGILYKGPNKKFVSEDIASTNSSYISTRWYFNENINV